MNRKAANFGIALLVIGLIVLVVGLVLWFSVKEEAEKEPAAPELLSHELQIINLKLCNNINEDFVCDRNIDGIYKPGDTIHVFFDIFGLEETNEKISYTEDFELYDSDGNLIPEGSKKDIVSGDSDVLLVNPPYYVPMKNRLPMSATDPLGKYTIKIIAKDLNSKSEVEKSITFELR